MMSHVTLFPHAGSPAVVDLLPAVAAHLGVPGFDRDEIGLPDAARYVVVLVDGLGWTLAQRAGRFAPYLAGLVGDAVRVATPLPSTTAASLMSLWTGAWPGTHGVVGFSFRAGGGLVGPLSLVEPLATVPSVLDRAALAGVAVSGVVPGEHVRSGLTRMGTRRAELVAAPATGAARIAAIRAAARRGDSALVYVYEPELDHAGHASGVASTGWSQALTMIDAWLEELRAGLDADTCLIVTGDHGMLDSRNRLVIEDEPALHAGLDLIGGEARFRHLYTAQPAAVAARWQERLGDAALVLPRAEAIAAGLFGPVDPQYADRLGDVVVVPLTDQVYLTRTFAGEFSLIGFHGAMTPDECWVPVLVDEG